jgi:hypothetical protein
MIRNPLARKQPTPIERVHALGRAPLIAAGAAAGLVLALVVKARASRREPELPPVPPRREESATAVAAKATATSAPAPEAGKPAADVEPEKPKEPQAATEESGASSTA